MRHSKAISGFTLIELIVTMVVLAILVTMAVPAFTSIINNNRLTSNANEMLTALQSARMEAVRRNQRVVVCRPLTTAVITTDAATACDTTAGAWGGWLVFTDGGGLVAPNGIIDDADLIISRGTFADPVQLIPSAAISLANARIHFRSDGLLYSDPANNPTLLNAQFAFCIVTTEPLENTRLITIGSGSRMSISRVDGGGLCNAPLDS